MRHFVIGLILAAVIALGILGIGTVCERHALAGQYPALCGGGPEHAR